MNPIYCGNIFLKKENYNIETSIFRVSVSWHKCLKQILPDQLPEDEYYLEVNRDDAKNIFYC